MSSEPIVMGPWQVALFIAAWLVVFPLFCMGIGGLLSVIGGWRELAATYRVEPSALQASPGRTTSGAFRRSWMPLPVNYSHCLRVHLFADGFGLGVWRIFSFMHPPLFIPWTVVSDCRKGGFLFMRYTEVSLHGSPIKVMVGGWPGHKLYETWTAAHATAPRTPALSR
jgi:hypothetical protein